MKRPLKYHISRLWLPVLILLILLYFVYHFIEGEHGYLAWNKLGKELAASEKILQEKNAVKAEWENRVGFLNSTHLDPDLLEEQARKMLNQAKENEVILLYSDPDNQSEEEGMSV